MISHESRDTLFREAVGRLDHPGNGWTSVRETLAIIRRYTLADAVGLRLAQGPDFPYRFSDGFSSEFLRKENSLLNARPADDHPRSLGLSPPNALACTCGLVLAGRLDSGHPLATPAGGVCCNDARSLLDLAREADPRTCPRNECVHAGYRSLALMPIRVAGKTIGLLQINKRIEDGFDAPLVARLEELCDGLGVAIRRALREDERRIPLDGCQRLNGYLPDVVMRLAEDGRELFVSDDAERVLGRDPSRIVRDPSAPLPRTDGVEVPGLSMLERACRGRVARDEYLATWVGDERRIFHFRVMPETVDDACDTRTVLALGRDVTDQHDAQEAYRMLLDQICEGVAILTLVGEPEQPSTHDFRIDVASPGFERIFKSPGKNPATSKLVGMHATELDPEIARLWIEKCWRVAMSRTPDCVEYKCPTEGRVFSVKVLSAHEQRIVCVLCDVTAARNAEEARQALYAQLLHAQKMEAIGRLAGGIAHDFNNILTAMTMQLDVLQSSLLSPDGKGERLELVEDLFAATARASSLTRKLLLFSRREAAPKARCEVSEVIADLAPMLKRLVGPDVVLSLESRDQPLMLDMDPSMVEQVLMNLCINARDALGDRRMISISSSREERPRRSSTPGATATLGVFARISVKDSGSGIDSEILPHIFDPFFTTKDSSRGTGLGLSTVHGILTNHHGWVDVDTRIGEGTTFSVYLPIATSNEDRVLV
ncbi:MAG: hypothetical protein IPK13_24040 [Deltaproteobacteria bacterium]|nr:hypothetical protein [Deltaproteobacteria bacterium]